MRKDGDADAEAQLEGCSGRCLEVQWLHSQLELRALLSGNFRAAAGAAHDEFISAIPAADIVGAEPLAQRAGDRLERLVARAVPVPIVDRLEVVEINHQQRQLNSASLRPRQLARRVRS